MNATVQTKLFIGFLFKGDLKSALHQSAKWKESTLFQNQKITITQFQNKEYIGFYEPFPLPYAELSKKEQELRELVYMYCSCRHLDKHKIYLFPQIFLN